MWYRLNNTIRSSGRSGWFRFLRNTFTLFLFALLVGILPLQQNIPADAAPLVQTGDSYFEINVNSNDDAGGTGCTLREALAISNASGTASVNGCIITSVGASPTGSYVINLPAGDFTYTLSAGSELEITANAVQINGDPDAADETIIQAAATPNTANYRVFFISGSATEVEFNYATIRYGRCLGTCNIGMNAGGGFFNQNSQVTLFASDLNTNDARLGGGFYNVDGVVVVNNSTIRENKVFGGNPNWTCNSCGGAGFYNENGAVTIQNSIIGGSETADGNTSLGWGGGFSNWGNVTIDASIISNNMAWIDGGGVYVDSDGSITIDASVISNNTAGFNGGGMAAELGGSIIIQNNSAITGNSAADSGGGFHSYEGSINLTNVNVGSNTAENVGAGFSNIGGQVTLDTVTVAGNTATVTGGGFYSGDYGTVTVTNSTIGGTTPEDANTAYVSGGFGNEGGTVTLTNSVVTGNTAQTAGGFGNGQAMSVGVGLYGTVTLDHSTVSYNTSNDFGGGFFTEMGATTILQNNSAITGNSATDSGGGFYTGEDAIVTITNATISGNTAAVGGAFRNGYEDLGLFGIGGTITVNSSIIMDNVATSDGSAIQHTDGTTTVNNSCIVGNSNATDVSNITITSQDFTNNWWGSAAGPSGAGSGSGDSVSTNIDFDPWLTSPMGECSSAPVITNHPESQTILSGTSAELIVQAAGATPLSYEWYRGTSGDTSQLVSTNSPMYVTPPLTSPTSYWVRVSNIYGSVNSQTATITIRTAEDCDNDTVGIYRDSDFSWYLRYSNTAGFAETIFNYGLPSDVSIIGDWDGDGYDTVGIRRGDTFYLKNDNTGGSANITFAFGAESDIPVAGDWNGDGIDTIGVYRPDSATWFLRNSNSSGAADLTFVYGLPNETPVVGDWDGNTIDTVGIYRDSDFSWYLRNSNSAGFAETILSFGLPSDDAVVGDWNGDCVDTVGIYRKNEGNWYLKNTNESGIADLAFAYGLPNERGVTGHWLPGGGSAPEVIEADIVEPAEEIAAEPAEEPTVESAGEPVEEAIAEPTEAPTEEVVAQPTEEPTVERNLLVVEVSDPAVAYFGNWTTYPSESASGGSYMYSSGAASDRLELTFEGTYAELLVVTHPSLGNLVVEVDGVVLANVGIAQDSALGVPVIVGEFPAGIHTLRVYPEAEGMVIAVDAFVIDGVVIAPTPTSTPIPTETFTPAPTDTPIPTSTPEPITPTPTETLMPVSLPVLENFDDLAEWEFAGNWQPQIDCGYSGSCIFISTDLRGAVSTLQYRYPIDLRSVSFNWKVQWTLQHNAMLSAADSVAYEVSTDGGTSWQMIGFISDVNVTWEPLELDLSGYIGQVINLRISVNTLAALPENTVTVGYWLDEIQITAFEPVPEPTETAIPTESPAPIETVPPTEIPVQTEAPALTEEPLPPSEISPEAVSTVEP